jgi:hypothetical protein
MEIQEYLTCAIQNIQVLISRGGPVKEAVVNAVRVKTKAVLSRTRMHLWLPFERSFLRLGKSLAETFDISNAACLD